MEERGSGVERPSPRGTVLLPAAPQSWFYAGDLAELSRGPTSLTIDDRRLVVFRGHSGRVAALDGRCIHMGADLSKGCVDGERLRCPLHDWSFNGDGRCVAIPALPQVPEFARTTAFPTAVTGPHAFVYNGQRPDFAMPFFDGVTPADLRPARPFGFDVDTDWWMIAANGFDLQHFRTAHDRMLVGEPVVSTPSPFARRIVAHFEVTGAGLRDRLTRHVSGRRVTMSVTSWCGTIVLVEAVFRRTTSYGMVCVTPLGPGRSRVQVIVWVRRSRGPAGRLLFDPIDAAVRRSFIRAFVLDDRERSAGIRYDPAAMIAADATLVDYFDWLSATIGRRPNPNGGQG